MRCKYAAHTKLTSADSFDAIATIFHETREIITGSFPERRASQPARSSCVTLSATMQSVNESKLTNCVNRTMHNKSHDDNNNNNNNDIDK